MTLQKPKGSEVFERWIEHESKKRSDPLTQAAAQPYLAIWSAWLKFLDSIEIATGGREVSRPMRWSEARNEHVLQFLRPRAGQKAAHNPGRALSEVTRRRYWRVLDRIYGFAVLQSWIDASPVADIPESSTPKVSAQLGHVLPERVWQLLPNHFPIGDTMYDVRDRAILFLLYELALAPEELRNLRPIDITFDEGAPSNGLVPASIRIDGKREHQRRVLLLPPGSSRSLKNWLEWRGAHQKSSESEWLFMSNRGSQMAISVLFSAVAETVVKAGKDYADQEGQGLPKRVGPQVIRNTAIAQLLRKGMPPTEVVNFIGIKNDKGLQRLKDAVRW